MPIQKILNALEVIAEALSGKNIEWAIIGSLSQFLQGLEIEPKDIDIISSREGAKTIQESLKEHLVEKLHYKETESYKAHYCAFNIKGVEVEVLGELVNKVPEGDLWTETKKFSAKRNVFYNNLIIPVISLEQELCAQTRLGKKDRAQRIKQLLGEKK